MNGLAKLFLVLLMLPSHVVKAQLIKDQGTKQDTDGASNSVVVLDHFVGSQEKIDEAIKPAIARIHANWIKHMPADAKKPKLMKGIVKVAFLLMADGSPKDIVISQPATTASLNKAAFNAVKHSWHKGDPSVAFPADLHQGSVQLIITFRYN